ncbi:MAG: pyruvate kinase [Devosia sp.]|nr:pyruvate kinase [Devosia sp.]
MDTEAPWFGEASTEQLLADLEAFRRSVVASGAGILAELGCAQDDPALINLAQYVALRREDLRPLQQQLMWRGLSSLGRLESRVLPTLDATLAALAALAGRPAPFPAPTEQAFLAGQLRLQQATDRMFGPPLARRRTRIMVTLPSAAADDPGLVLDYARCGMDIARINCAHDDHDAWRAMARHVRAAGHEVDRHLTILMDIAGPKIRTAQVAAPKNDRARLGPGDVFRLVASGAPRTDADVPVCASVTLPEIVTQLAIGDRVRYDDGRLEGLVERKQAGEVLVRVTAARSGGTKLKPAKGLNLPDTTLNLAPLTDKDQADLSVVVECADVLGYSFVSRPGDIDLLEAALAPCGERGKSLGLVAKVERPEAISNLPDLIARAAGRRPLSIMIARGDLAAEIGFERLAEMQEEILWICEAAGVPAIWATQVLEGLIKDGVPSRGEMTDAAMAGRAECVMLNKGPALTVAIEVLDRLLSRMDRNMFKKTPTLRALKSW